MMPVSYWKRQGMLMSIVYVYHSTHVCVNRLLNTMLVHSSSEQIVIEHENLSLFFEPQPMSPLVFHQYTQIICNTLHAELLLKALEFATRAVVYINAITHSLIQRQDRDKYIVKQDTLALMNWGAERLDEEGRGVGIGMGFNRLVAKNVMHLLWALTAYGLVSPSECGKLLTLSFVHYFSSCIITQVLY